MHFLVPESQIFLPICIFSKYEHVFIYDHAFELRCRNMVCRYLTAFYPSASVVFIWWRYLNDGSLDGETEAGLLGLSKNGNQF